MMYTFRLIAAKQVLFLIFSLLLFLAEVVHSAPFWVNSKLGELSALTHPYQSTAPAPGGIDDSNVDLFTGKVNLEIPLGGLSDGSSPPFSLTAQYNSNTLAASQVWNTEVPTNDTGFGWSLNTYNAIVRYTNETGSTNDDIFYHKGQRLEYVSSSGLVDRYTLKESYSNNLIYHDRSVTPNLWTVVGSDGTKYLYGGTEGGHSGVYAKIVTLQNNKCLTATGSSEAPDLHVVTCSGADDQKFSYNADLQQLKNVKNGLCATARALARGNDILLRACTGEVKQQWVYDQSTQQFKHPGPGGYCMNVDGGDHTNVIIWYCESGDNERWSLEEEPDAALVQACSVLRDPDDPRVGDCETGSVEYGVKWGNWVGPRFSDAGQDRLELAWNLSAVEDPAGNRTTFSYVQHMQKVGTGKAAKAFTKGAYLYKVSQQSGQHLSLWYCSRTKQASVNLAVGKGWGGDCGNTSGPLYSDYEDPWVINPEPDGYQERLRVLYLGAVGYFPQVAVNPLRQTVLEYAFETTGGDASMAKRKLVSVSSYTNTYAAGTQTQHLAAPPYVLSYYGEKDGVCVTKSGDGTGSSCPGNQILFNEKNGALYGALKSVETPLGLTKGYRYASQSTNPWRQLALPSDLRYRKVLFGNNYALVLGANNGQSYMYIYQWTSSGWRQKTYIQEVDNKCGDYGCDGVVLGEDYVAFLDSAGVGYVVRRSAETGLWGELKSLSNISYDKVVGNRHFIAFRRKGEEGINLFDTYGRVMAAPSGLQAKKALGVGLDYVVGLGSDNKVYVLVFDTAAKKFMPVFSADFEPQSYQQCDKTDSYTGESSVNAIAFLNVCEVLDTVKEIQIHGDSIYFMTGGSLKQLQQNCASPDKCTPFYVKGKLKGNKPIPYKLNKLRNGVQLVSVSLPAYRNTNTYMGIDSNDLQYILSSSTSSLGSSWAMTILREGTWPLKTSSWGYCYSQFAEGGLQMWNATSLDDWKSLSDCSPGSLVNGAGSVTTSRNGLTQAIVRTYNPKTKEWVNTGNVTQGTVANAQLKNPEAVGLLIEIQEAAGYFFMVLGFTEFPIGTIISTVFLGLQIATEELEKQIVSIAPRSASLSERYVNDGNSLWFVTHDGKVQPLGSDEKGSGSLVKGLPSGETLESTRFTVGAGYIPFTTKSGKNLKTYVRVLRNGELGKYVDLKVANNQIVNDKKDKYTTISGSQFITYGQNKDQKLLSSTGDWHLYRFIQDTGVGAITDYVVSEVSYDDGIAQYKTDYSFDAKTAAYNGTGMYASATVYPGGKKSGNGSTAHYFYNGNNPKGEQVTVTVNGQNPSSHPVNEYAKQLAGRPYKVETYRADVSAPISSQQSHLVVNIERFEGSRKRQLDLSTGTRSFLFPKSSSLPDSYCVFYDHFDQPSRYTFAKLKDCSNANYTTHNIFFINDDNALEMGGTGKCLTVPEGPEGVKIVPCNSPAIQQKGGHVLADGGLLKLFDYPGECFLSYPNPDRKGPIDEIIIGGDNCNAHPKVGLPSKWYYLYNPAAGGYVDVRTASIIRTLDGVSKTTAYSYNHKRQLLSQSTSNTLFDPQTGKTQDEVLTTNYIYAWEKYPGMLSENRLSAPFQTLTTRKVGTGKPVGISSSVTTYKNWGAAPSPDGRPRWLAQCSYRAEVADPAAFALPGSTTTCTETGSSWNPQWQRLSSIEARDAALGRVTQVRNIDGTLSRTVLTADGSGLPLAAFHNAEMQDAAYYGAEIYEALPFSLPSGVAPNTDRAFTGDRSLKFSRQATITAKAPTTTARPYTAGAWVYSAKDTAPCTIGFGSDTAQPTLSGTQGWSYIQHTASTGQAPILKCNSGIYVDDFHYGPSDGSWSATVYDMSNARVVASLGPDGGNAHQIYDPDRQTGYISYSHDRTQAGVIRASGYSHQGWSRFGGYAVDALGNTGSVPYDKSLPNTASVIGISGASKYINNLQAGSQHRALAEVGPNFVLRSRIGLNNASDISRLEVVAPQSADNLVVAYNKSTAVISLSQSSTDINQSVTLPNGFTPTELSLVVLGDVITKKGSAFLWVNGKLVLSVADALKPFDDQAYINNPSMDLGLIVFGHSPVLAHSYVDAMGRTLQGHSLRVGSDGGFEDVMSGRIYDGWGNTAVSTKVAAPNSMAASQCSGSANNPLSLFDYCSDFITAYDWGNASSTLSGKVADYWQHQSEVAVSDTDYQYAFVRQTRFPSPLARSKGASIEPGKTFNTNAKFQTDQTYQNKRVGGLEDWVGLPSASRKNFHTTSGDTAFSSSLSLMSDGVRDLSGSVVARRSGQGTDNKNYRVSARGQDYEINDGVYTINSTAYPPNYYKSVPPDKPKKNIDSVSQSTSYGILGLHTVSTDPDTEGETHLFRDKTGFVRFACYNYKSTDKNQGCAYFKRDHLGRILGSGTLKNKAGSPTQYLQWADDSAFPKAADACVAKQYFYDYAFDITKAFDLKTRTFNPSGAIVQGKNQDGKLFAIAQLRQNIPDRPGNDCGTANTPIVLNYYDYDQWGHNTLSGAATQQGNTANFTFRNTGNFYDEGGKLISMAYPTKDAPQFAIDPSQKQVFYFYNPLLQLDRVCDSANCTTKYASQYHYDLSGRIVSMKMNNEKLTKTHSYDFQSRLVALKTTDTSGSTVFQETLSYQSAPDGTGYQGGNITSVAFDGSGLQGSDHRYAYTYDIWGRLTAADKQVKTKKVKGYGYQYDLNGNITRMTQSDGTGKTTSDATYTYSMSNRLATITDHIDGKVRYFKDYDVWGAVNTMTAADTTLGENTFSREAKTSKVYRIENDRHKVLFSYDALGRRTRKTSTETRVDSDFEGNEDYKNRRQ